MRDRPRRVMIVEDHSLVREGLKALIAQDPDLILSGEAGCVRKAQELAREQRPDLAIIDLALEDGNGLELIRRLNSHQPSLKILVCSMSEEALFAERALIAGAHGYIQKREVPGHILQAIHQILAGNVYLSPEMVEHLIKRGSQRGPGSKSPVTNLSNRELEVFCLIGKGLTSSQIAERLKLSDKTIESHREKIKRKLGLSSGSALMREAVQWDLEQH